MPDFYWVPLRTSIFPFPFLVNFHHSATNELASVTSAKEIFLEKTWSLRTNTEGSKMSVLQTRIEH